MAQPKAPTTRGRRVPLVAVAVDGPSSAACPAVYVCGSKPLSFGEYTLTAGIEVPGAGQWTRIQSWIGARRVRKINPGEKYVTWLEFTGHTYAWYLDHQVAETTGPSAPVPD